MCGRVAVTTLKGEIEELVNFTGFEPHFNIAPTGHLVTIQAKAKGCEARMRRWGLIPSWAKDAAIGAKTFNARAESIAEKPSFRTAFKKHRCLIPVDGFFEWAAVGKGKVPFFISNADPAEMLVFAGLYETWLGPDGVVESCTIITTEANPFMAELHTRMPVILPSNEWDAWLAPETSSLDLQSILKPCPDEWLQAWQVNPLKGDGHELIEPVHSLIK